MPNSLQEKFVVSRVTKMIFQISRIIFLNLLSILPEERNADRKNLHLQLKVSIAHREGALLWVSTEFNCEDDKKV